MTTATRPRKELGQHWLTDSKALARIAKAARIGEGDTVIEIGPGKGALTRHLVDKADHLVLVEFDSVLAENLAGHYADNPRVQVIEGDALEIPVEEMLNRGGGGLPYVVVGNLPYFIGSAIVRKFLTARIPPRSIVATLQAEVAERMAAKPGNMSYLSVETQLFADAELLFRIPPRAFRPPPKVHSAVVRLEVNQSMEVEVDDAERFLEFARAGFAAPRKQLRNSLAVGLRASASECAALVEAAGLEERLRPGALSLDDWRALYFAYRAAG